MWNVGYSPLILRPFWSKKLFSCGRNIDVWARLSKERREYYCIYTFYVSDMILCVHMPISLHCNDACKFTLCHKSVCFKQVLSHAVHKQMYVWENIIYGVKNKCKKMKSFNLSSIRWGTLHRNILLPFTAETIFCRRTRFTSCLTTPFSRDLFTI